MKHTFSHGEEKKNRMVKMSLKKPTYAVGLRISHTDHKTAAAVVFTLHHHFYIFSKKRPT
jgi:hypothetical protein